MADMDVQDISVVSPDGRLDSVSSPVLERRLRDLASAGHTRVVLDLERVSYISSAGLRVFVVAGKLLGERAGRMVLAGLSVENRRLFELSGFSDLFTILPSRAQAIAEFG